MRPPIPRALCAVAAFTACWFAPAATFGQPPREPVLTVDQAIEMFQAKLEANPDSPLLHVLLGQMYVRKAREAGDFSCYARAEPIIRRALELDRGNLSAEMMLAQILCANHKFAEGLRLAREAYRKNPGEHGILILMGDAQLELGQYADAEKTYAELLRKDPTTYLASRRARLAELKGDTKEALRLMKQAAGEEGPAMLSPEGQAWYPTRLAEMEFNAGRLEDASRDYEAALKIAPRYYLALAGLGRVRAAQGNQGEAVALYRRAVAVTAELPVLAELGDLYARTGKDFLAQLNYEKLEKTAGGQSAYRRELALFWCDHDRNLAEALELARQELELRQDVSTHDALAWALCKNGRYKEAAAAINEALRLGTADARFHYHAAAIYQGLGDREKACLHARRALALNPHFSPRGAEHCRRILEAPDGR
jgi:tetratricopeptide (TPR) repeat protein